MGDVEAATGELVALLDGDAEGFATSMMVLIGPVTPMKPGSKLVA